MLGSSTFRLMCFYARAHECLCVYAHGPAPSTGQPRFGGSDIGLGSLSLVFGQAGIVSPVDLVMVHARRKLHRLYPRQS